MTNLKLIERSATPAFYGGGGLIAAGTVAGAIDMSFSTSSVLEVFSLDFTDRAEQPVVVGTVPAPERFHRLAWGNRTPDAGANSMGILAGGLADGSVCLWDPALIINKSGKTDSSPPLLARLPKHTGAVKGLEFNQTSPNLLASGAADSDLCIWDLTDPSKPSLYPALKTGAPGSNPVAGSEITYVSWNRKVQHIVASCSSNGTTVVWDLKRQKPVISFRDANSSRRCSSIQWNPDVATQLIVASDDDRSACTLQMWDLRNSAGAVKEFVGHDKGVLGMAWCTHDPSLLLSTAKDNRTIVWDVQTTEILCELPAGDNWNFDVQWSPTLPGVFTTASYDGKIGVTSLHACTGAKVTQTVNADFSVTSEVTGESTPLKRAPVWMRRPVGATWGFGGRLVSFAHTKQTYTDHAGHQRAFDHCTITSKQVVTETEIVSRSEAFERAISGNERGTLREYCVAKSSISGEEGETWAFLSVLFEDDARRQLLTRLGFQDAMKLASSGGAPPVGNGAEGVTTSMDGMRLSNDGGGGLTPVGQSELFDNQDDPDFFDNLPEQGVHHNLHHHQPHPGRTSTSSAARVSDSASITDVTGADETNFAAPSEVEAEVQKYLLSGNYEAAVESCFQAEFYTDALLIANISSADLFKRSMRRYMQRCPRPYTPIMGAMLENDYSSLVKTRPVSQWRETLAVLATYTVAQQWTELCDALANRLVDCPEVHLALLPHGSWGAQAKARLRHDASLCFLAKAGLKHAASLCFICSGNVEGAVQHWAKGVSPASDVDVLQAVIEKAVVMGQAGISRKGNGTALSDLVTSYASILAAQGRMGTALEYLEHVPGEASTTVAVLKDRIYRSGVPGVPVTAHAPPFPFVRDEVQPATHHTTSTAATAAANPYAQTAGYGQYGGQYNVGAAAVAAPQQPQGAYATASTAYGEYPTQAAVDRGGGQSAYGNIAYNTPAAQAYPVASSAAASAYNASYGQYGQQQQQYNNGQQYSTAAAQQQQQQYNPEPAQVYQAKRPSVVAPPSPAPVITAAPVAAPVPQAYAQQPSPAATPQYVPQAAQPSAYVPQPAVAPANTYRGSSGGYAPQQAAAPISAAPAAQQQHVVQQPSFFVPTAGSAAPAPFAVPAVPGMPHGGAPSPSAMAPTSVQKPAPPPPPPGPPANISVQTADVSKVPAAHQPIVASLANLFNSCLPLANNPAKKREMDDNTKKLGQLFWRLNAGDVSPNVIPKLLQLCATVDAGDWHTANHIQVQMTTTDWDECGYWLSAVKRLVKMRQSL